MPIVLPRPISVISQAEFHLIHERLVGHSIAIQNQLGRLLPEAACQNKLASRCAADGLCDFCSDVGLALDTQLYREALTCLTPLPTHLVPLLSGKNTIGHQEMLMVDDKSALAVSSLKAHEEYRVHLSKPLSATHLQGISWVNLTLGEIRLEYISRP